VKARQRKRRAVPLLLAVLGLVVLVSIIASIAAGEPQKPPRFPRPRGGPEYNVLLVTTIPHESYASSLVSVRVTNVGGRGGRPHCLIDTWTAHNTYGIKEVVGAYLPPNGIETVRATVPLNKPASSYNGNSSVTCTAHAGL
jgi:hypothetical protein